METAERFRNVVEHLADGFSCGQSSVSRDDVMDENRMVADEIHAVLRDAGFCRAATGRARDALEALGVIESVWHSGYNLASGDDFATDSELVSTVICDMADEFEEGPSPA